jgi:hypothetical protein
MSQETIIYIIGIVITETVALIGLLIPVISNNNKAKRGRRCLLRSQMLETYYDCRDGKTIRQYEFENFVMLYEAYKALKGNSFIDTIYGEVKTWKIVT